jgi:hypothetical protein
MLLGDVSGHVVKNVLKEKRKKLDLGKLKVIN